jgi:hypothetical protein
MLLTLPMSPPTLLCAVADRSINLSFDTTPSIIIDLSSVTLPTAPPIKLASDRGITSISEKEFIILLSFASPAKPPILSSPVNLAFTIFQYLISRFSAYPAIPP